MLPEPFRFVFVRIKVLRVFQEQPSGSFQKFFVLLLCQLVEKFPPEVSEFLV